MSSKAREAFIQGISSLEETLEESWASESTHRGAFVRRGLTVASFNLLETFIMERLDEIAGYLNAGDIQYMDLPPQQKIPSARSAIEVVSTRRRRVDDVEMERLSVELSRTLASLHTNKASFSSLSWVWSGSNMSIEDFITALKRFHVKDTFNSIRVLSGLVGFPAEDTQTGKPLDLRLELSQLAQERHASAHDSAHSISTMWLKTVGRTLIKFGATFDIFASVGASNLRAGTAEYLHNDQWTDSSKLTFQIIKERTKDYALTSTLTGRARKTDSDGTVLFRSAIQQQRLNDVVVSLDSSSRLIDWSIPTVG